MTHEPLISVIIPVFNGELYLRDALESVFSQTYRHFEVIIVDDGSTDRTSEVVRSFLDIQYIFQQNRGVATARNQGISIAKADLLTFLDADDIWPPERLQTQISYILKNPGVDLVFGRCHAFLESGVPKPVWIDQDALEGKQVGYFPGTLLATRKAIETVGPFNEKYRVGEGAEWFVRAKESGIKMGVIDEVVLHRRVHHTNLTYQSDRINSNILHALKESIDRKRQKKFKNN